MRAIEKDTRLEQGTAEAAGAFLEDVLKGLSQPMRAIPGKYIWDEKGSSVFEELSLQDAYYATSREMVLLREHAAAIAAAVGPEACIVEFGNGATQKIGILLDAMTDPKRYVAIDISSDFVGAAAARLQARYPKIQVIQVCADYSVPLPPLPIGQAGSVLGFFPGTSIGNMEPENAKRLLLRIKDALRGGWLLIGQDPNQDEAKLTRAYGSRLMGVLHENLLARMVRELGADVELEAFKHEARVLKDPTRVEAHVVANRASTIAVGDKCFSFAPGDSIRTDMSWKFTESDFRDLVTSAGWTVAYSWMDPERLFGLHLLRSA